MDEEIEQELGFKNSKEELLKSDTKAMLDTDSFRNLPKWAVMLRCLRYIENYSQEKFAHALGLDQTNISRMELGRREISFNFAKKIEKTFNVDHRLFLPDCE